MSLAERDKYTGHMTTGHEWNGIKELNTPVPKVLIGFLIAGLVFSIGYWIVMPAWPLGDRHTKGTLGFDQRDFVEQQLRSSAEEKSVWSDQINQSDFRQIVESPELMQIVSQSGPALYEDNCAMCHGAMGDGALYFPRLNDQVWLWGGKPEEILHTLTVGINSRHKESRIALMPAFGDSGVLPDEDIEAIVVYLQSISGQTLSGQSVSGNSAADSNENNAKPGEEKYGLYCAGCHAADGSGNSALGAPRLNDDYWIYGSDADSLKSTLMHGRNGYMPAWQSRLSLTELKILSLYVLSLANGKDGALNQ